MTLSEQFDKLLSDYIIADPKELGWRRQDIKDFVEIIHQQGWKVGHAHGAEIKRNEIAFIKHLKKRCPSCGAEGKLTYEEALNFNALFGECLECVTKRPACSAAMLEPT